MIDPCSASAGKIRMTTRKTVLIIDDEPDTCTYFAALLEDHGFSTLTAYDGEEGLKKFADRLPDLVTLDISMPEKSGVKLYREIKGNPQWRRTPVIIITGVAQDFKGFISSRKQVPPPEGYLSKPVDPGELVKLAKRLTS